MNSDNEKKKRRGFFNFFGGDNESIESIDELFERMHEEMFGRMEEARGIKLDMDEEEIRRRSQNPNVRVYGYSMRVGPDGKPQIREFGNVKPQQGRAGMIMHGDEEERPPSRKSESTEEREPLVDIFSSKGKTVVVVELPGVAEKDINVSLGGKRLEISVDKGERKYFRELELPKKFSKKKMKKTYNNGVLELVFS